MAFSIDLSLFDRKSHNPSLGSLKEGLQVTQRQELVDFCIPVNPYFPTPAMLESYQQRLREILKYYPNQNQPISRVLAEVFDLDPKTVVMANGSTEAITWIDHLLIKESLATPVPTFGRWTDQPLETAKRLEMFERREAAGFELPVSEFVSFAHKRRVRAAAICNPNNPTGVLLSRDELHQMLRGLSDLDVVVVDESFIDFSVTEDIPTLIYDVDQFPNLIVVKSLGKNFGMHGVRFGFTVSNANMAQKLRYYLPHWNINALAEAVIRDLKEHWSEYETSRRRVIEDREYLMERLGTVEHLQAFPSHANFVFAKCLGGLDGKRLRDALIQEHGCFIRECGNKIGSSSQFLRIAANPRKLTDRLVDALNRIVPDLI